MAQNNIKITRHTHNSACYCKGTLYVTEKYGKSELYYCPDYGLVLGCTGCSSKARLNCSSDYYYSKNIGDSVGTHDKASNITISYWDSGTSKYALCGIENGKILSIKINGVEYIN